MLFRVIFPLVFLVLTLGSVEPSACGAVSASGTSSEDAFRSGLAAFQKGDDAGARMAFTSGLASDPTNVVLLYNLGLTESHAGNKGLAIALWRKALVLQPDFASASRAVSWTKSKLEHAEIAHESDLWESFRSAALTSISLNRYLITTLLLFLISGWLVLRYFGQRQRAQVDEKRMSSFPVAATFATALCLVFIFLSASKLYDASTVRATIIVKKTSARSSPNEQATPLFDLFEGLEVTLQSRAESWTQVTYPGGSTGWISNSSFLATNDPLTDRLAKTDSPPQTDKVAQ